MIAADLAIGREPRWFIVEPTPPYGAQENLLQANVIGYLSSLEPMTDTACLTWESGGGVLIPLTDAWVEGRTGGPLLVSDFVLDPRGPFVLSCDRQSHTLGRMSPFWP